MHRRAFLDLRHLAQTAGQVLSLAREMAPGVASVEPEEAELTLVRYARPAMGTVFEIVLPFGHAVPSTYLEEAFDQVEEIEGWMSIYRSDSEVSEVNARAAREPVTVSEELYCLLRYAGQLSAWTEGAFDVASGALVKAWGYVQGPRRVPTEEALQQARQQSGFSLVKLSDPGRFPEVRTVQFLKPGVELNFGSIGKGYALDVVGAWFAEHFPEQPVLLHGGKSSILARGTPPGHSRGWSVTVEHPWQPSGRLTTLYLRDEALATSANTFKHVVHAGKKLGHVLNPRTGWPAEGIASATFRTSTATLADALSTACFIEGVEWTRQFLEKRPVGTALLLPEPGELVEVR